MTISAFGGSFEAMKILFCFIPNKTRFKSQNPS